MKTLVVGYLTFVPLKELNGENKNALAVFTRKKNGKELKRKRIYIGMIHKIKGVYTFTQDTTHIGALTSKTLILILSVIIGLDEKQIVLNNGKLEDMHEISNILEESLNNTIRKESTFKRFEEVEEDE